MTDIVIKGFEDKDFYSCKILETLSSNGHVVEENKDIEFIKKVLSDIAKLPPLSYLDCIEALDCLHIIARVNFRQELHKAAAGVSLQGLSEYA